MNLENMYKPDGEKTEDRLPAACPYCGHTGAFDGQGGTSEYVELRSEDGSTAGNIYWAGHRCTDCGGQFKTVADVAER